MSLLPFGALPPFETRRFVPENLDLGAWHGIAALFDRLEQLAAGAATVPALTDWLLAWSELSAVLDEEASRRYIAMTCHTDSPEAERAYLDFVENIEPKLKPRQFALEKLYLDHPLRASLPADRYGIFERLTRTHVDLFRDENVPLETEESRLGQQYQKLVGSLTVDFQGKEHTLVQMERYLEETDRELRERAWRASSERRLRDAAKFEEFFDGLTGLRARIATNTGFSNYRDYAFKAKARFDYGPAECEDFHSAVESEVMPVLARMHEDRRKRLGLATLRPWDLAVDPENKPPLRPFSDISRLVSGTQAVFDTLDDGMAADFRLMVENRLLDLDNRKGKAPGGYQSTLSEARLPFIFMNAVGQQRDVETLLHEAGHAFHALAERGEPLYAYRNPPIEFCEVASMSMELLGNERLETFYTAEDAVRARRDHLEGIVEILPWIAIVDAFQHWVYTHPGHTRDERTSAWVALMRRFGGNVDWSGLEEVRAARWHRQLHIYLYPFYYIEYGIAQLGALQVWANAKKDRAGALAAYKRGLALGGSRPLPELFATAGCRFEFSAATLRPLMRLIQDELDAMA